MQRHKLTFWNKMKDETGKNVCPSSGGSKGFDAYLFIFLFFFAGVFLIQNGIVQSDPASFNQSDWSGGIPTDSATCSSTGGIWLNSQCLAYTPGYSGYSAIETGVLAGSELQLGSSDYHVTLISNNGGSDSCSASGCSTGGGFNAGTFTKTNVSGTGAGAAIELAKVLPVEGFGTRGTVTSNPTQDRDVLTDIAVEGGYIYLSGYITPPSGDKEWYLEKRHYDTGALVTPTFNTNGYITSDPSPGHDHLQAIAVEGNYIYAAGDDFFLGNNRWHIEKWDKTSGAMVTTFDGDGIYESNPSPSDDFITDMLVDGNYLYIAGYDYFPSNYQWRIKKMNKTDAAPASSFGIGGYIVSNSPGPADDVLTAIAVDTSYIYAAGYSGQGTDNKWRVEKRKKSDGALETGFDGESGDVCASSCDGVVENDPTVKNDEITAVAEYNGYIYIAGYEDFPGDSRWRIEKRNTSDGKLATDFDGDSSDVCAGNCDGAVVSDPSSGDDVLNDIIVDGPGGHMYLVGYETVAPGDQRMRIEKRDLNGVLLAEFNETGVFTDNPSSTGDILEKIAMDGNYIFAGGYDDAPGTVGDYQLHVKKLTKSGTEYAVDGDFESATIDLGRSGYGLGGISADVTTDTSIIMGAGREISSSDNGLVALWHMNTEDNSDVAVADSSGNGRTGNIFNGGAGNVSEMWDTGGRLGTAVYTALKFDGVDDYVNIGSIGGSIRSISLWINPYVDTVGVLRLGPGRYIRISAGSVTTPGLSSPMVYVDGVPGPVIVTTSTWHHVVVVMTAGESGGQVQLGHAGASYYMDGLLDEVAFYDRVLSAHEVKKLYDGPAATFQIADATLSTGPWSFVGPDGTTDSYFPWEPVGLWHLNESDGASAADSSGRGHNGTLTDMDTNYLGGGNGPSGWNSNGLLNNVLEFDGVDDVVMVGDVTADVRSVEFWVNLDSPVADAGIMQLSPSCYITVYATALQVTANGFVSPTIYIDGVQGADVLTAEAWHHVAVTTNTAVAAQNVKFGVEDNTGNYLEAKLDEIVMYDRALTPEEVNVRYNYGSGREGAAVGDLTLATVLGNKQYIRYKAGLHTGDTLYTPLMNDLTVDFSGASTGAALTSSVFDTGTNASVLKTLSWNAQPNGQEVRLQVASSADNIAWNYCGPTSNCSTSDWLPFTTAGNYYDTGNATLHDELIDADKDRYFKYKVWMGSTTGTGIPVFQDIDIGYDTAHLEVFDPQGSDNTHSAFVGQQFNVVVRAKDSAGDNVSGHAGNKTVKLVASVTRPDGSGCTSSFVDDGNTTFSSGVNFVGGEASVSVILCETGVTPFEIDAQETAGGALDSMVGGIPLTISEVNTIGSTINPTVNLDTNVAGQTSIANVSFTAVTDLNAGYKVKVVFDGAFDIGSASSTEGSVELLSGDTLTVTLGSAVTTDNDVDLDIDGIINPLEPRSMTSDYEVYTLTDLDALVDSGTATGSTIVAAFSFTSPVLNESWAVNENKTLAWTTNGTVDSVTISYAVEPLYSSYVPIVSDCSTGTGGACEGGAYAWTVDDILLAEEGLDPQTDPDHAIKVRIKIADADTGHPAAEALSNILTVKYYAITWQVEDIEGTSINGLDVSEAEILAPATPVKAAWTESGTFGIPSTIRYYPYNGSINDTAYTTTFSHTQDGTLYTVDKDSWRATGDDTINLVIGTNATSGIKFKVNVDASYNAALDALNIVAWLTKKGDLVPKGNDTESLSSVVVKISEGVSVDFGGPNLAQSAVIDDNGIISAITYDPDDGIKPDGIYRIKAEITHYDKTYTGLKGSIVPSRDTSKVRIRAVYDDVDDTDQTDDALKLSAWLERGSITLPSPAAITLEVIDKDGTTVLKTFNTGDATLGNGVYSGMHWNPSGGINANEIYMIKAQITYNTKTYVGMEAFSKGELGAIAANIASLRAGITSQTAAIESKLGSHVTTIEDDIAAKTTALESKVETEIGDVKTDVDAAKAVITPEVDTIKTKAVGVAAEIDTSLPPAVTAKVVEELEKGVRAEIVTRLTTVITGATVPVRFRTVTGLTPQITVYDPKNSLLVNYVNMTEVSTTGIYEYKLTLNTAWGLGDFTVVVTEPTKQSVDSLILQVMDVPAEVKKASTASVITTDTVYSRLNSVNSNIDTLLSTVAKVDGNTSDVSRDVDKLLKKSTGDGTGEGGIDAMKKYVDEVVNAIGTEGEDSAYQTILGKLADTESTLAAIGQDAAIAVAINQKARRQAYMIAQLAMMVREKLEAGEIEGAEEDMTTLSETLKEFQVTIKDVPGQVTSDSITTTVGAAIGDLKKITEGKVLEDIVPAVTEGLTKAGKAGPKEMLEMRNDVSELKSLMVEIRSLLDQEVNQPIVHGWLEGDE